MKTLSDIILLFFAISFILISLSVLYQNNLRGKPFTNIFKNMKADLLTIVAPISLIITFPFIYIIQYTRLLRVPGMLYSGFGLHNGSNSINSIYDVVMTYLMSIAGVFVYFFIVISIIYFFASIIYIFTKKEFPQKNKTIIIRTVLLLVSLVLFFLIRAFTQPSDTVNNPLMLLLLLLYFFIGFPGMLFVIFGVFILPMLAIVLLLIGKVDIIKRSNNTTSNIKIGRLEAATADPKNFLLCTLFPFVYFLSLIINLLLIQIAPEYNLDIKFFVTNSLPSFLLSMIFATILYTLFYQLRLVQGKIKNPRSIVLFVGLVVVFLTLIVHGIGVAFIENPIS